MVILAMRHRYTILVGNSVFFFSLMPRLAGESELRGSETQNK